MRNCKKREIKCTNRIFLCQTSDIQRTMAHTVSLAQNFTNVAVLLRKQLSAPPHQQFRSGSNKIAVFRSEISLFVLSFDLLCKYLHCNCRFVKQFIPTIHSVVVNIHFIYSWRNLFKFTRISVATRIGASAGIERCSSQCCTWKFGSCFKVSRKKGEVFSHSNLHESN